MPEQVPGLPYARRCVELRQIAAGGDVQVTPAQGSALHAPLLQPLVQVTSVGA